MHELVVETRRVIVIRGETQVALIEVPDTQWGPRGHYDPLADVKLLIQDYQRVLYVFLDHPDLVLGG
jgi:hypothetical protein